jgi:hypothetical protein
LNHKSAQFILRVNNQRVALSDSRSSSSEETEKRDAIQSNSFAQLSPNSPRRAKLLQAFEPVSSPPVKQRALSPRLRERMQQKQTPKIGGSDRD